MLFRSRSRAPRELWGSAQENFAVWQKDRTDVSAQAIDDDLSTLFASGSGDAVLARLAEPPSMDIEAMLEEVISVLALENTYVLRRGDLEHYCRTESKSDKVSNAMKFCDETRTLREFKVAHGEDGDSICEELQRIFASIFRTPTPN